MHAGEALAAARAHALAVLEWNEVAEALATRCASAAAARRARSLLPDLSLAEAERSLRETEEARLLIQEDGLPVTGVRDVGDVVDLASKGGTLEPGDLAAVARTLHALDRLRSALDGAAAAPLLAARALAIEPQPSLVRAIERAVDERGELRDDASPRLLELARRKVAFGHRIEAEIESLRRDPEIAACLMDDFVTVRDGRHVLPVRTDRRASVPGILHGRSGSGQSLFIEPARIVELNNDLAGTVADLEDEAARILRELSARVGAAAPAIAAALAAHEACDLASARARLATAVDGHLPAIVPASAAMELRDLAHPRLVLLHGPAARTRVVRNDVLLDPSRQGAIITGPNTGGKTVLLEAAGLACLMVRAGLFPSCGPETRVPFLEGVFADIGDEQSIERSLSSFSGHVAQLRTILAACEATEGRALVLVDEIMAGTDPAEGGPLAQAMLEAIAASGARVIATTHMGFLKAFAAASGLFENAGMEFDEATLRPTYRVRLGVPGASAALFIAEKLGLPPELVGRARDLAETGHLSVEALLRDLERAREEALSALDRARRASEEAARSKEQLRVQLERVASRDETFMRDERAAFEKELRALREQAASITRRLQEEPSHALASEAARRVEELRVQARQARGDAPAVAAQPSGGDGLAVGSSARSRSLERVGEILDAPDARGRVRVRLGRLTLQLPVSDLEPAPAVVPGAARSRRDAARPPRAAAPPAGDDASGDGPADVPVTPPTPRNTLDLRGATVDEALGQVARFLERSSAAGERCVVIIHGHGTGALKAAVRSELRHEALVAAFRPGRPGEGSDGVTVARLR